MITVPGFEIFEKIHAGQRLNSFRARHLRDQQIVLIKIANHPADNYLLETGYAVAKKLDPEMILSPIDLKSLNGKKFLVLEDFGAKPLSEFQAGPLPLTDFFELSIKIIKGLSHIHESNIIHNDINPDSLWFNPYTRQLKISGFGLSKKVPAPAGQPSRKDIDQYTIEYMSPEQTGRTQVAVTRATDFYSLGCTLYQLATGRLPFTSQDALELIHCHLARLPKLLHHVNAQIPEPVSLMIMKLLEKNPDDRYQSCAGLQKDFTICQSMVKGNKKDAHFRPGQHDPATGLCFSENLYGREKEIQAFHRALAKKNSAEPALILVSGAAGVGKSAVVKKAWKQLGRTAYFITAHHDKVSGQSAEPHVFELLGLQMISEGAERVEEWKIRICKALGPATRFIVDIAPMLEFILGRQEPAVKQDAIENGSRIKVILRSFIETVATEEHPLIIFLDDLQWVSPESIQILETIEHRPIKGFYLVCAFRNDETGPGHPFTRMVNRIKKNNLPVLEQHLTALDRKTQDHWISDLFCNSDFNTRSFSKILFEKTDGNPFFIKLFLEHLAHTGLLFQTPDHSWKSNLKQMDALPATDNVGDFMINKINQLDGDATELLKIAACLGAAFSPRTLEIVHAGKRKSYTAALDLILRKGILIKKQDRLKFVHHIVQESVYAMMPELERTALHLRAGRQILARTDKKSTDRQLFTITDQMNAAGKILSIPEERIELARLNLKAGQKKRELFSLDAAEKYFQSGIALLPADTWISHPDLSFSLVSQHCETLYILGRYDQAEHAFGLVLKHARQPYHLLKIFEAKSVYHMQSYQVQNVIDTGLSILTGLDYTIGPESSRPCLIREDAQLKKQLQNKKISDLIHLPEINDPRQAAIIQTLVIITRACALKGHPYAHMALLKAMQFVVTHGITPYAAYVFSLYGAFLSNFLHDIKNGYAFGRLSIKVIETFKAEKQEILIRHLFIITSMNHLGQTRHHLNQMSDMIKKPLKAAGFINFFNLHVMYFFLIFISGFNLETIEQKMLDSRKQTMGSNQAVWIYNLEMLFQVVRALRGGKSNFFLLDHPPDIHDDIRVSQWEKNHTIITISDYFLYRQILSYFLYEGKDALKYARKGASYFNSYASLSAQMLHRFFYSLALFEHCNDPDLETRQACLKQIRKNQTFFTLIYDQAPGNSPHLYFLLEAELARIKNQFKKAADYYDRALATAKGSGNRHMEAICCELTGKFFLEKTQPYLGRSMLLNSIRLYREWGSEPKARAIECQYAGVLTDTVSPPVKNNRDIKFKDIDMSSVLKASQAISREIKPKRLMKRLIQLILENSGAQRAFLLLHASHQMKIKAFAQTHPDSIKTQQDLFVEKTDTLLAGSIVYYVFSSRKSLILDNAALDSRFNRDPYIVETKPVSILCTPIIGKKNIQGVLYLENNLMIGAFTQHRLKVLDILIAQVIISIENSRLYETLRNEIKKQVISTRKIKNHQAQLRKLSSQLAQAEERERKAIADDLHDSVTQTLAMSVSMLKSMDMPEKPKSLIKIKEARNLLEQSLANIRSLTFQLSSPILYDLGLEPALEWLCEDFLQKHGLQLRFVHSDGDFIALDETVKITVYRSVRELIINIIKHAETRHAELVISMQDNWFIVCVKDNGRGFNPVKMSKSHGFGLFSISERMRALNGRVQIHSCPGKGTCITIKVPVPGA